jgi:hypothetical protein
VVQHSELQEWLTVFLARWHHFAQELPFGSEPQHTAIDVRLTRAPALSSIPRMIYALLRCTLLATSGHTTSADSQAALRALWPAIGPDSLLRAIHPLLVAFDDPNTAKHTREPLSQSALAGSDGHVLLLDAYHVIVVMYCTSAASQGFAFPPPADCELRATVRQLAASRGIAPEVWNTLILLALPSMSR